MDGTFNFSLRYSFQSPLYGNGYERYITNYNIDIVKEDEKGNVQETVGKAELQLLLVSLATDDDYSTTDIFESNSRLEEIGQQIYDFENDQVKEEITEELDVMPVYSDICVISRFEILPEYRKNQLGKKVIKDIYNRFCNSCKLFVMDAMPVQFANTENTDSSWAKKMKYNSLDNNLKKSQQKLNKYFEELGFSKIENLDNLLFLPTEIVNQELQEIEF